jgi:hypothetical protein
MLGQFFAIMKTPLPSLVIVQLDHVGFDTYFGIVNSSIIDAFFMQIAFDQLVDLVDTVIAVAFTERVYCDYLLAT